MAGKVDQVDGTLYRFMQRYANRPGNRPVVDAVEVLTSLNNGPVSADQVTRVAMRAARDQLVREGRRNPSDDQVRARAYWGAAIAAEEKPFMLAEDTRAKAKAVHYLVSGAIAARVASWLPFLPAGARHLAGRGVAKVIGVLKECADQLKGTGFNRTDLATDAAGARAATSKQ